VQSTQERTAQRWEQERPHRCAQGGGAIARKPAQTGLPRRDGRADVRELSRSYLTIVKDVSRVMNRLKALYRSWAIPCAGRDVYYTRHRAEWLAKIKEAGVRRRAERLYQQLDMLKKLRQQARGELLAESRTWFRQLSSFGGSDPDIHEIRLALSQE
jgi:hypothetical protein